MSYFPEQNNPVQAVCWEQSLDYAQAQIGVKYFCRECQLGQFKSVVAGMHANNGTKWTVYARAWAHNLALLSCTFSENY